MVRDLRIKELRFPAQNFSAAGADLTLHSDKAGINGEILSVDWVYNSTGSVFITVSGTGQELFRRNAPSGTGVQFTSPAQFTDSTTGSIANASHVPFVVNAPLILNVLNSGSVAQALSVNVRYR